MVRFGNVFGSSGSVVPKFIKQIQSTNEITLTDLEVERFFMSRGEAASLVLDSCEIATGGETFVLDMGQPVKIYDICKRLAMVLGKTTFLEGQERPSADAILIRQTGLRPGEKMSEALFTSNSVSKTSRKKINKETNEGIDKNELHMFIKGFLTNESRTSENTFRDFIKNPMISYSNS